MCPKLYVQVTYTKFVKISKILILLGILHQNGMINHKATTDFDLATFIDCVQQIWANSNEHQNGRKIR